MLDVREQAKGRWPGILASFGLEAILSKRHTRCPMCGGKDRFRFDDLEGRGTYYCNHCGAGDGFKLLMEKNHWDFKETAYRVREVIPGAVVLEPDRRATDRTAVARKIWKEAKPVTEGDDVQRYLASRGLTNIPSTIRIANIPYYDNGEKIGMFNAMVTVIRDVNGTGVSLHTTYLKDGKKAPVAVQKKIVAPGIKGCAATLFNATDVLGITEGIETALAVNALYGVPVWAALNAGNMEAIEIPEETNRVMIYCDNDDNFTGQKAGYALANRLALAGKDVSVSWPADIGEDFADVWFQEVAAKQFPFAREKLDMLQAAGCTDARVLSASEGGREIGVDDAQG